MIKGTTPTHKFNVDRDLTLARVYVTYKQRGSIIVERNNEEETNTLTIDAESVSLTLTQEETLKFYANEKVDIQIRAVFEDGEAIASNITSTYTENILKSGEIVYDDNP